MIDVLVIVNVILILSLISSLIYPLIDYGIDSLNDAFVYDPLIYCVNVIGIGIVGFVDDYHDFDYGYDCYDDDANVIENGIVIDDDVGYYGIVSGIGYDFDYDYNFALCDYDYHIYNICHRILHIV